MSARMSSSATSPRPPAARATRHAACGAGRIGGEAALRPALVVDDRARRPRPSRRGKDDVGAVGQAVAWLSSTIHGFGRRQKPCRPARVGAFASRPRAMTSVCAARRFQAPANGALQPARADQREAHRVHLGGTEQPRANVQRTRRWRRWHRGFRAGRRRIPRLAPGVSLDQRVGDGFLPPPPPLRRAMRPRWPGRNRDLFPRTGITMSRSRPARRAARSPARWGSAAPRPPRVRRCRAWSTPFSAASASAAPRAVLAQGQRRAGAVPAGPRPARGRPLAGFQIAQRNARLNAPEARHTRNALRFTCGNAAKSRSG